MPRKDPAYSAYARHYDAIGQRVFGERTAGNLIAWLALQDTRPRSILDLACGTGAATIPFARMGFDTTGLDISAEMLVIARERAESEDLSIVWFQADMTDFELDAQFDLVTCFYDAVNYLNGLSELARFAAAAHNATVPGGYLVFDINTRRKLKEHWQDSTVVAADTDERYIVYQSWFDEEQDVSPLVVNIFERTETGTWNRFTEEHVEYAFAITDVVQTLNDVGYSDIQIIDWQEGEPGEFRDGTETSFRVLFLAHKSKEIS